jgi:hypothetical protein
MIFADDCILHRVRQGQQHHLVERVELRQLAFPARRTPTIRKMYTTVGLMIFSATGRASANMSAASFACTGRC